MSEINYKENTVHLSSDIAMIALRYCGETGVKFETIKLGSDGCYRVYLNTNLEEIPDHYLTSNINGKIENVFWADLIDDSSIERISIARRCDLHYYVCGGGVLINMVTKENNSE